MISMALFGFSTPCVREYRPGFVKKCFFARATIGSRTVFVYLPLAKYDNNQHAKNENIRLQIFVRLGATKRAIGTML